MIETVIGDGNKFHDVSFVWLPWPTTVRPEATGLVGARLGLTSDAFVASSAGEDKLRSTFVETLLRPEPRPMAGDTLRFITELSRTVPDFPARRRFVAEFTRWISEGRTGTLTEWQRQEDSDFRQFQIQALRRHVLSAFDEPLIIVQRSPPSAETVMSLLSKGSGVAIGAYIGFQAAGNAPLFLYAAVPAGMLLCGTAAGIAEALQLGLRQRIFSWIAGSTAPPAHPAMNASQIREMLERSELPPGTGPNHSQSPKR